MGRSKLPLAVSRLVRRGCTRRTAWRFIRFGAVGASGVGVNTAVFWVLTHQFGLHYLLASPLAIEVAMCSNYILNNNWTFADRRAGFINRTGLARYHAVSLGGMAINMTVLGVLSGAVGIPPLFANLVGIGVATVWNFVLSALWAWRRTVRPLPAPSGINRAAVAAS